MRALPCPECSVPGRKPSRRCRKIQSNWIASAVQEIARQRRSAGEKRKNNNRQRLGTPSWEHLDKGSVGFPSIGLIVTRKLLASTANSVVCMSSANWPSVQVRQYDDRSRKKR